MKQVMKPLFVLFITALCLNSDTTTSSSTHLENGRCQAPMSVGNYWTNWYSCVATTPMPKSLAYRKWILQPLTPPCVSIQK